MRFTVLLVGLGGMSAFAPAGGVVPPIPVVYRFDADGHPLPPEAVRRLGTSRFLVGDAQALLYSADGKTVYVGGGIDYWPVESGVGGLSAWDTATGRMRWQCATGLATSSATLSEDGRTLWASGVRSVGDKSVVEWLKVSASDGTVLASRKIGDEYRTSLVSETGRAAIVTNGEVKVYADGRTEPLLSVAKLPGDQTYIAAAALSADGTRLVVADYRFGERGEPICQFRCFDVDTGKRVWESAAEGGFTLQITPDGKTCWALLTFTCHTPDPEGKNRPNLLRGWDMKTGEVVATHTLGKPPPFAYGPLALSPDGTRCVMHLNSKLTLIDLKDGKPVRDFPNLNCWLGTTFSPDGETLACAGRNLSFVDVATGKLRAGSPEPDPGQCQHLRLADDSSQVGLGSWNDTQVTFALRTGKEIGRAVRASPLPGVIRRAPDETRTITVVDPNGIMQAQSLWNHKLAYDHADQGKIRLTVVGKPTEIVREWPAGTNVYNELVFSGDGNCVLAGQSVSGFFVWNMNKPDKPKFVKTQQDDNRSGGTAEYQLHPSPCGRFVAAPRATVTAGEGSWSFGVYALPSGDELKQLDGPGRLHRLAWSADGNRLLGGGTASDTKENRGVLVVGDTRAGRGHREFRTKHPVSAVALSADGRTAAVGGGAEVQLWDVEAGAVRHTFAGLRSAGGRYGFTPDGKHLVTDTADGTFVWDVRGDMQRFAKPTADDLERCWAALAADAPAAFAAVRLLTAYPADSLPFLKRKAAEVKTISAERAAALIGQLGDRDFKTREAAERELLANLDDARTAVEKAVNSPVPEVQERAERLAKKSAGNSPERLRLVRAVEAAEWVGDKEAVLLLRHWATNGPAVLRSEAEAALKRLKK